MANNRFDYIIVGQGLAGSAVAVQLMKRDKMILVIDQPGKNTSSHIAAGLFNPVTGRKMVKTWLADTLFPYLHSYYREVEERTDSSFFHPMPLYRPFISIEEQNEWMGKSADAAYEPYIDTIHTGPAYPHVNDPFGGLLLKQCGYLDTTTYIRAVESWITRSQTMLRETLDPAKLTITKNSVAYGQYEARHIIFCHGVQANPYFSWLPIRPLKGETIRIRTERTDAIILNRGVYVVPAGKPGEWRVGATYKFEDQGPEPTAEARQELEEKVQALMSSPYEVISQESGFRPTVPDHRPLLGSHPESKPVITFNGLGTKGVSLAPYFSEILVHSLENNIPVNKLVDIERYKSLYSSSPK